MRPLLRMEKRGDEWIVVLRSGRVVYSSTCYPKAVGVHEYFQARVAEQEAETCRTRQAFKESIRERTAKSTGTAQ